MFWIEKIRSRQKYCICSVKWLSFRIIHIYPTGSLFSVYMTSENGARTAICHLRKGEPFPKKLEYDFTFDPFEHVKIEVVSGDIILVGEIVDAAIEKNRTNGYPAGCAFADLDSEAEWVERKHLNKDAEAHV